MYEQEGTHSQVYYLKGVKNWHDSSDDNPSICGAVSFNKANNESNPEHKLFTKQLVKRNPFSSYKTVIKYLKQLRKTPNGTVTPFKTRVKNHKRKKARKHLPQIKNKPKKLIRTTDAPNEDIEDEEQSTKFTKITPSIKETTTKKTMTTNVLTTKKNTVPIKLPWKKKHETTEATETEEQDEECSRYTISMSTKNEGSRKTTKKIRTTCMTVLEYLNEMRTKCKESTTKHLKLPDTSHDPHCADNPIPSTKTHGSTHHHISDCTKYQGIINCPNCGKKLRFKMRIRNGCPQTETRNPLHSMSSCTCK